MLRHRNPDRLLHVACLVLVGIFAVGGCGGSGSSPDAKPPAAEAGPVSGPEAGRDTAPQTPVLSVSTPSLTFGDVDINQASAPMPVIVTNLGALVPLSPAVVGAGFVITSTNCATAAASCTISVQFSPTTAGAASGTLTVATGLTVSLSGTGITPGSFTAVAGAIPATLLVNQGASISVTITATAALTGLTCLSGGADLTADPANTTCTGTVAANVPCAYGFTFKSATAGAKNDSIVCSAAGTSRTVVVNPTVLTPAVLAITPNPGTFSVAVGSVSSVITFNLANSGGSVTGALATTLTGTDADQFQITDNKCVVPLASLGVCAMQVVFKPTSAGAKTATITVTDATAGSTPASTILNGTPLVGPTVLVTGAATLGTVAVGKASTPSTFTVTNSGGATTGTLSLSTSDPEFAIGGDLCSGQTLAPTKTCTFAVTFTPTTQGAKSAVLTVSSGATVLGTFQTGATGGPPITPAALGMTPPTLDFGTIGVGTVSATQTFTVTNTGGTATTALTLTNTGVGGASQFTYTTTCQAVLAPAATCQVVVTFKPTIAGSASATFTASDGSVLSPARTVVGTALDRPGMGIVCAPSSFADTVVGQTSAAVVCTVSNDANSKQATGALTTTPTGDFAIPTNNCAASLDPGLSCTMSVVFKPTAAGARTGTIVVTGANGGAVNQNLTGTGLGSIEIQEFTAPATGTVPNLVDAGNYDFGSVSTGATADTTVVLAVYIRGSVGNITVAQAFGTPADFAQVAGAVSFTWPGTGTAQSVGACLATTTTAPTPSATVPYCTIQVSFTPQSKGAKTGTVTVTGTGAGAATASATVKGTAGGPISVNPSLVTFAAVAPGTAGPATTLQVCNNAATQATAAQFAITGTNAADFAVTLDQVSNATIAAKACVNLALNLDVPTAETAAALSATVTVSATIAGVVENDTASLVGASASGPVLAASLGGGVFTDTPITATSGPVTVTVSNTGGLGSGALTFSLPSGSEFSLTGTLTNTGPDRGTCASSCTSALACTAGPLAAGAGCTLNLWFLPTPVLGVGGRTDTLRVGSASGAIAVLPLSANALGQITATPDTVALGPSGVAGVGAPIQTVTIKNVGGASTNALTVAYQDFGAQTGAGVGAFRFNPDGCTGLTLDPGETCPVVVQMSTTTPLGPFSTTMLVTNPANGQSAAVVVGGTAAQATLQFTPATAMARDFGTVPRGSMSAPITYTVRNVGGLTSGTLTFGLYDQTTTDGGVVPGPAHAKTSDFVTTGTTCGTGATATLAPGATCNIVLAFNPTCVAGGTCTPTASPLTEYLIVQATPGTATAGLISQPITAATTADAAVVYLGDQSTPPKPVYDFGTGTAAPVTLALYNASATAFTLPATATFPSLGLAGTVAPGVGEFTIVTTTPPAGTCGGFGGGTTLLPAGTPTAPSTCTFRVRWIPGAAAGTRAVSLTVGTVSMVLYARVGGPAVLVATPSSLNFGTARVGVDSPTLTVTVTNIGDAAMAGNLNRVIPANITDVSGCTGAGLAAGASCTLVLDVVPPAAAAGTADVIVSSSTAATQSVTIPVSWNGTSTVPAAISISGASPLNLGAVTVLATSGPTAVAVSNVANGLPTGSLSFTVDSQDFAVDAPTGTGGCGNPSLADGLNGGQSCTVTVTFTPRTLANPAKTGTLTVKSPYVTATKALSGTAIAALSVSGAAQAAAGEDSLGTVGGCTFTAAAGTTPASCAYGTRAIAATAFRSETFTFQNATGSPTTGVLVADVTGTDAAQFRIVDDTCTGDTVDGGASCKVTVRFSPTTTGAKTAALSVSGTPGDSVSVNLTGTGN